MIPDTFPDDWREILADEFEKDYFTALQSFVAQQREAQKVYPPEEDVFNAFSATPFTKVEVLLLGQDPYHGAGQAHGMCFSVKHGVRPPPSLVNMFKELETDLGCKIPNHGCLQEWAERGVLLLNAVMTVREKEPNSHKDQGWETFTDAVIRVLDQRERGVVFVLWGNYAQKKAKLVKGKQHRVLKAAHPSPLSVAKFFGCKPYSAINAALAELGRQPIDWTIKDR
jgi:uracil-DNA glycosylase